MADQAKWVWGIVLHRYIKRTPWLKEPANNDKDLSLSAPGGNCFSPSLFKMFRALCAAFTFWRGSFTKCKSAKCRAEAGTEKKSVLRKSFSTRLRGEIPAHLILNSQRICQIQAYPITNVWLVFTYFIGKFVQVPTIQLKKQSPDLTYICAISPTSKLTKTSGTLTVKSGQLPALSDSSGSYEGKTQALQGRDQQHKTEIKRYWNLSEFNLNSRRLGRSILEIICYVISKSLLILKIPFQVGYP